MKKFLYIIIGIFIGGIIFAQTNAISNWTQTVWKNNIYGIFSPSKNSLEAIPNISIHPDSRLGVGLTNENSITDSSFRSGDVIAKRYCFEDSKECVSTFQQSVSGNTRFNITVSSNIATNVNGTQYTDEQKAKGEPFYITVNKNTLDKIGITDEKTSNWFTIGSSYKDITSPNLRSFWVQEGDTFSPKITKEIKGHYTANTNEKLVYCNLIDPRGGKMFSSDITRCSEQGKVAETYICDTNSNACGYPAAEFRIVLNNSACHQYNYFPSITVRTWGHVEITNIASTPYSHNYDTSTFSDHPVNCRTGYADIQMRFKLLGGTYYRPQSLVEFAKSSGHKIKIVDFGLVTLQ